MSIRPPEEPLCVPDSDPGRCYGEPRAAGGAIEALLLHQLAPGETQRAKGVPGAEEAGTTKIVDIEFSLEYIVLLWFIYC